MTLKPPHVYIGRTLMNNYALAATPLLAGLSFDWGTDSQIDFDDPATLKAQLLVKEPSNTDFLAKGAPLGVLDPDSGETLFAGRITTLKAKNHPKRKGALLISITAADTLADLNGYRVASVDWPAPEGAEYHPQYATTGRQRRSQLAAALPRDWALAGTTSHDWYAARPQRWVIEPYLPLLDMHLRACIGRRHNTSRYVPGAGLENRLTITDERSRELPTETLRAHANGTWYMSVRTPPTSGAVALSGRQVAADIEWEKTPDDTITDVALKSWGITYGIDSETDEVNTDPSSDEDIWVGFRVDLEAWQRRHGFHSVDFDVDTFGNPLGVDLPGSGGANIIEDIANYWLDGDTQWRPTGVTIPDSRRLHDALVLNLLSVTRRYSAYATIDGLPANNPAGGSRVRGFVIAGSAEWTGKKWVIELTLGRVPRPHPDAGTLTFYDIRGHWASAINAGTAATVGSALSFADFAYIGD